MAQLEAEGHDQRHLKIDPKPGFHLGISSWGGGGGGGPQVVHS